LTISSGTPKLLADADEHVPDLAEALLRDAAKERGDHRAVVDIYAGGTAADRVHARHLGSPPSSTPPSLSL
jgi:hypothetical protein